MTAIQLTLMTVDEARATVDRIKARLEDVRADLYELREREGWRALGYETWQSCITEEFHMSRQRAHQLVNAHMVDRILAGTDVNNVDTQTRVARIPESHARELEPLLGLHSDAIQEVYAEVQEQTSGKPRAADYREAVDRRLGTDRPSEELTVGEFMTQEIWDSLPSLSPPAEEKALDLLLRLKRFTDLDPYAVAGQAHVLATDEPKVRAVSVWVAAVADALRDPRPRIVR